jgi:hypothetical protein
MDRRIDGGSIPVTARKASVARWNAGRLAEPDLAPDVHLILLDLKRSVEERVVLLTPGPDQAG